MYRSNRCRFCGGLLPKHEGDCQGVRRGLSITIPGKNQVDEFIATIASPDAPTTVNVHGGAQSDICARFDLIDARAMFAMAQVLDHGAKKYGENNWRKIPVDDHLNHLLMHTYAFLAGDRSDDHLSHILCRATFAAGVALAATPVGEVGA